MPLRQMEIYIASLSFRLYGLKYTLKRCINATILTHTKNREYKYRNRQGKAPSALSMLVKMNKDLAKVAKSPNEAAFASENADLGGEVTVASVQ